MIPQDPAITKPSVFDAAVSAILSLSHSCGWLSCVHEIKTHRTDSKDVCRKSGLRDWEHTCPASFLSKPFRAACDTGERSGTRG